MSLKRCISLVCLLSMLVFPVLSLAQGKRKSDRYNRPQTRSKVHNNWKTARFEYQVGIGFSNYLGELGGRDQEGSGSINDLEISQMKFMYSLSFRYFLAEKHALKGGIYCAKVAGDDRLTAFPNRRLRNLQFRSNIREFSMQYEYHFLRPKVRHFWSVQKSGEVAGSRWGAYGFVGLGLFSFNPQAQYNGEWVDLQPLGTEGQGLSRGGDFYSKTSLSFPMGLAVNYVVNPNLTIGFEYGLRLTRTDYLDDVSGTYYDNDEIRAERGDMAADLADPNINPDNPFWYVEGGVRGDPDGNDSYMFFQLTVTSKFKPLFRVKKHRPAKRKKGKQYKNPRLKRKNRHKNPRFLFFRKKGKNVDF